MRPLLLVLSALFCCGCFGPPREVVEPAGVRIVRDLTYATVADQRLQLDLYLPDDHTKPLPLVMWIHGGGWVTGERSPCPIARLATRVTTRLRSSAVPARSGSAAAARW